ncbi:MAG TPA: enolase C-terminal domain-like protein, partial [Pyrinomonadaceae bacterium]
RRHFPQIKLMADANSAYTLGDVKLFQLMDEFDLMMIEQPLAHDDMLEHARLQARIRTPLCLDESVRSARDARHALDLMSCRIINIKLGRVGGHAEAREVEHEARSRGIDAWCGGMLESGIGRAHNIAMSTLEGFTLPGDVSASSRYWEEDIIEPPVTITGRGTIEAPESIGLGFEIKRGRIDSLTVRREEIRAT